MSRNNVDIDRIFSEGKLIDRALRDGVRAAMIRHKQLGLPVVDFQDGKIVLVPPQKIDTLLRASNGRKVKRATRHRRRKAQPAPRRSAKRR
ncbi:MAG: hypothetical protein HYT87_06385 [Nitrospirae bacterium]|nr:hypothetical protein [Nitrospirota bacterium]